MQFGSTIFTAEHGRPEFLGKWCRHIGLWKLWVWFSCVRQWNLH